MGPKQARRISQAEPAHPERPQPEPLVRNQEPRASAVARAWRAEPVSRVQVPVAARGAPTKTAATAAMPARLVMAGYRAAGAAPEPPAARERAAQAARPRPRTSRARPRARRARSCRSVIRSPKASNQRTKLATA